MKKIFTLVAAALCSMSMMAKDYTCPLVVNLMGNDMPVGDIKVNVDEQKDGKYTMSLLNFDMNGIMPVGISLSRMLRLPSVATSSCSMQQRISR